MLLKRKFVHVKRLCECGCGEEIGLKRSDHAKVAKKKKGHNKNKVLFIDEKCKCGCGEIIGNWKQRPDRDKPKYKKGHLRKNTALERRINNDGYVMIYKPEYKNSYKSGHILEHRYVMENYLQRDLLPNEDVHHINKNKQDNRIENLEVVDHLKHTLIHASEKVEKKRRIKDEDIPNIKKLRSEGKLLKEIANLYNVTPSTILNNLRKHGYTIGYEQGKRDKEKELKK